MINYAELVVKVGKMIQRPVIGVVLDYEDSGSFSSRPHFALRCAYFEAINAAGGLPVGLPYLKDSVDKYLNCINGLLIPGGFYPFPTTIYSGDSGGKNKSQLIHPRYAFESYITQAALENDIPVLGICAGMQVLAASEGALLHASIRDEVDTIYDHLDEKPAEKLAHPVRIEPNTQLHEILKVERMEVNTAHNEALKTLPETVTLNAWAPDGIVEGVELPRYRFAIGVQWHPEFFIKKEGPNLRLFQAFLSACR